MCYRKVKKVTFVNNRQGADFLPIWAAFPALKRIRGKLWLLFRIQNEGDCFGRMRGFVPILTEGHLIVSQLKHRRNKLRTTVTIHASVTKKRSIRNIRGVFLLRCRNGTQQPYKQ
jgi:hypothetical protein